MGLHYQLKNNELGLCLECGLVTEGAETGCVAYMQEGLTTLRARGLKQEMLDLFFLAYKLQHHAYFDISEKEAAVMLQTIGCYIIDGRYLPIAERGITDELTVVTLQTALSPIFMMQVLQTATEEEANAFIVQYVTDIWNVYAVYHAELSFELSE